MIETKKENADNTADDGMDNERLSRLDRFIAAQTASYDTALEEIRAGSKRSHWIWYIFPQIEGLGYSEIAKYYALRDLDEARDYIDHSVLGARLLEISNALLNIPSGDASSIMGFPDDMKLRSSMTLFSAVSDDPVFQKVLDRFYDGEKDQATLAILQAKLNKEQ